MISFGVMQTLVDRNRGSERGKEECIHIQSAILMVIIALAVDCSCHPGRCGHRSPAVNQHSADQCVHSNPSVPSRVPRSTRGGWDEDSAEPKGNWDSAFYGGQAAIGTSGAGLQAFRPGVFRNRVPSPTLGFYDSAGPS